MQFQEEQEYTSKFNMGIWKKLFRIAKPFYKYVIAIMLIMVLNGVLDVVFPLLNSEAIDGFAAKGKIDGVG